MVGAADAAEPAVGPVIGTVVEFRPRSVTTYGSRQMPKRGALGMVTALPFGSGQQRRAVLVSHGSERDDDVYLLHVWWPRLGVESVFLDDVRVAKRRPRWADQKQWPWGTERTSRPR